MDPKELAYTIARIIDDKQGKDITILDLRGMADIADYFVIATGMNKRLVDALADEVENVLRPMGEKAFAVEGREECTWLLMDFGPVIVHLFQPEARGFYRLERLWGDAPRSVFLDGEVIESPAEAARQGQADGEQAVSEEAEGLAEAIDDLVDDEE